LDFGSFSNRIRSRFVSRNPKPAEYSEENRSKVFLVHGRNIMAKKAMIEFLNSINIEVLEWTAIIAATQNPNAFLHEIIRKGFELAQAVVVLMTPDDIGNLREELCSESEDLDEVESRHRARQNVIYEAGLALGFEYRRTVLVELGVMKLPSDLSGMHTVRMNNSEEKRKELADKLQITQCIVDLTGNDWKKAGDFNQALKLPARK
jgi:predicted nucleotide-binding protein